MERTVSATEARIHFGELMRRVVENEEAIIVERAGRPHVVVLSVDQYQRLRVGQETQHDWWSLVEEARRQIAEELAGRDIMAPEEVIRRAREERSEQLLDNLR